MIRKLLIMILAISTVVSAKISLGLDMSYRVLSTNDETETDAGSEQERETSSNSISLTPVLGIHPTDLVEISPFFGWYYSSSKIENRNSNSTLTSKTKSSQSGIEPGLGLYFHLINNSNILDFSIGPKASYCIYFTPKSKTKGVDPTEYDTYFNGTFAAACQINIDLHFSKHFAARMSSSLYRFSVAYLKTELEDSDVTKTSVNTNSDFRSVFTPSLGFYFTF